LDYKFYGTNSDIGGANASTGTATILVRAGSAIQNSFLTKTVDDFGFLIGNSDEDVYITNVGNLGNVQPTYYNVQDTQIPGYLNWSIPEDEDNIITLQRK
jgi:hypothetical protein